MTLIWIHAHRGLIFALMALGIWGFANYWYLKTDIARLRRLNRPHVWSADMATRKSSGGRNKANH